MMKLYLNKADDDDVKYHETMDKITLSNVQLMWFNDWKPSHALAVNFFTWEETHNFLKS